ncbi:aminotransferase class III-fold pyridoxal phosphate-dependent enzyme [Mesorhizobium sp. M0590]|uniref:aminotransferase class III-fold pyridoxal phosphate-dependent enzyme n=1 Tax=Mesorhizobium sp. M0590 TaxID=2956966 RepID=UPI003339BFF9
MVELTFQGNSSSRALMPTSAEARICSGHTLRSGGYTYSGNQIACAAALGTLDTYKDEGLLTRDEELAPYWEDALHSLKGEPHVIDIRNIGLIGAIELAPIAGSPTKRAFSAFVKAFERGAVIRTTGDIIALSPPLIITKG